MIEDDFYATIKLKNGEEIFCIASVVEENDQTLLLVSNPIIVTEIISSKIEISGYKVEPWLKTTVEDMFILNVEDILTITENNDEEMIMLHQNFLNKKTIIRPNSRQKSKSKNNREVITKKMGYISNINEAKKILEKIFKDS
jgi:hypothetical protein